MKCQYYGECQNMAWRPIDSAPMDGTKILALGPVGPDVMYWSEDHWVDPYFVLNGSPPCNPTHWAPIPEMP